MSEYTRYKRTDTDTRTILLKSTMLICRKETKFLETMSSHSKDFTPFSILIQRIAVAEENQFILQYDYGSQFHQNIVIANRIWNFIFV